jgi:AcrR family transcriptional regulator
MVMLASGPVEVKTRRRYRSEGRRRQAATTRRAITEAARELFVERGYSGTTVEALAARAGVAAITVYATFGSKRAVLKHLVDVSVVGDEAPVPLLERPQVRAVMEQANQRRQLASFAAEIAEIMERMSPIFEVLRGAASSEPDAAGILANLLAGRLRGMAFLVKALTANGPLRAGLDADTAAETLWALSSPEVHRLLTVGRGWSKARYTTWLEEMAAAALLPG